MLLSTLLVEAACSMRSESETSLTGVVWQGVIVAFLDTERFLSRSTQSSESMTQRCSLSSEDSQVFVVEQSLQPGIVGWQLPNYFDQNTFGVKAGLTDVPCLWSLAACLEGNPSHRSSHCISKRHSSVNTKFVVGGLTSTPCLRRLVLQGVQATGQVIACQGGTLACIE